MTKDEMYQILTNFSERNEMLETFVSEKSFYPVIDRIKQIVNKERDVLESQLAEKDAEIERMKKRRNFYKRKNERNCVILDEYVKENAELKAENERLKQAKDACKILTISLAELSQENARLRNVPNEILAEIEAEVYYLTDAPEPLLLIQTIFAKFAQENGDLNSSEGENK